MSHLAQVRLRQGDVSGARHLIDRAVKISSRILGEEHPHTLNRMSVLADVLGMQDELLAAEAQYKCILEIAQSKPRNETPLTIYYKRGLALVQMELEKFTEAESLLGNAVRLADKILPEESLDRVSYHKDYGRCLFFMERFVDAEEHLTKAFEGYRTTVSIDHAFTQDSLQLLIELYDAWGKPEKAAEYRALLAGETEPLSEDGSE